MSDEEIKKRTRGPTKKKVSNDKSPFLTKKEVLELLPVSNGTLYLMMKEGRFPRQVLSRACGKGNIALWSKDEVMKWINNVIAHNNEATK
jgi:predicted DNA-binding transcriptional regulator AlpA